MKKILFVCLGNICRSPLAEGVMQSLLSKNKMEGKIEVDSAGIINYHEGELPDERMRKYASQRGYLLTHLSRPIKEEDFEYFDMIIGMDDRNIAALKDLAPTLEDVQKIYRMTDFCLFFNVDHVPDPYYGGIQGFEDVLDLVQDACQGLFNQLSVSIQDN